MSNPNFLVTLKARDKSHEKSYNVHCADQKTAEEWGERCLLAQKKDLTNYKILATPIVIVETAKVVAEPKAEKKAKKAAKKKE